MQILGLVRADARRRRSPAALRAAFAACDDAAEAGAWAAAEQALVAEIRTSPKSARRVVDAFARVAAAARTDEACGRAARLRGSWLAYVGRSAESLVPYREAARRLGGAARDGARLGIAGALLRLGRHDAARRECIAVRRDATRRKDALLAAAADLNEGVALHESGHPGRALPLFVGARAAFTSAGRAALAATAAQNVARALAETDRFDEAEVAYGEAAAALAAAGLTNDAARARHNRALLLVATDRLGDADLALREAEAAYRAAGDPLHAALARRDRGETLLRAGLVTEARHATQSAASALRSLAAPAEQARTAILVGRVALAAGDARSAATIARGPAAKAAARGDRLELEGRAAAAEDPARAARLLRSAAAVFGKTSRRAVARCGAAASRCLLAAGDAPGARRAARDAERIAARLRVPSLRFSAASAAFLAGASRREKDAALARSMAALESVRAGLGPEAMDAALLRGREAWLAAAVRHELDGPGGASAAVTFLERWRARSLVDLMSGTGAGDAPGDARISALRRTVAALERRAAAAPETGFLRDAAAPARTERRLRRAERDLLDAMARRRVYDAPPTTLDDVQRSLGAGTVVVSLFADADGGTAFVVTRDRVEALGGLASRDEIAALAAEMRFRFGSMTLGDDFARRHAARLARQADDVLARIAARTLAPIATQIAAARRIVFIPHSAWHDVPFAALPWRGRPLVAHAEVASAPALAALVGPVPPRADGPAVVIAFEDDAAPGLRTEAEQVAALLGTTATTGAHATSDVLAVAQAPAVLHIAAHGRHRTDAPALSGVRLADGWFRAAEFARLPLAGSLVVLSGCETGVSAVDAGDEVHGLVRGVLAAGARDLVASLWRVGDAATAEFMVRLHARIAAGDDPAAALAAVQCDAAAAGQHPWTWAGFALHTRNAAS